MTGAEVQGKTTGYGSDGYGTSYEASGGGGKGGLGLIGAAAIIAAIAGGAAVSQAAQARNNLQNNINMLTTNVNTLTMGVATTQATLVTQQTAVTMSDANLVQLCAFNAALATAMGGNMATNTASINAIIAAAGAISNMEQHTRSWIFWLLTLAPAAWADLVDDQETQQYQTLYPAQVPVYGPQYPVAHPRNNPLQGIGPIVVLLALGLGAVAAGVGAVATAAASRANIQTRIDTITRSSTSLTNLLRTQNAITTNLAPTVTASTAQVNSLCSAAMAIAAATPSIGGLLEIALAIAAAEHFVIAAQSAGDMFQILAG
eukprot:snap_masked-scaffold1104_size75374-processed-gene-0.8 protein:Tk03366 transcript:snap_masked-scaffold1104_size75374-processed-gene-0.8-mRNA-1 annotation:"hypothetical protein"